MSESIKINGLSVHVGGYELPIPPDGKVVTDSREIRDAFELVTDCLGRGGRKGHQHPQQGARSSPSALARGVEPPPLFGRARHVYGVLARGHRGLQYPRSPLPARPRPPTSAGGVVSGVGHPRPRAGTVVLRGLRGQGYRPQQGRP